MKDGRDELSAVVGKIGFALTVFILTDALLALASSGMAGQLAGGVTGLVSLACHLFAFAAPLLVLRPCMAKTEDEHRVSGADIARSAALYFAALPVALLLGTLFGLFLQVMGAVKSASPALPHGQLEIAVFAVRYLVVGPALETIIYFCVIITSLKRFSPRLAVAVSAVFFALCHVNFHALPEALVMGLVFGTVYLTTRSAALCMVLHVIHNALTIVKMLLDDSPEYFWVGVAAASALSLAALVPQIVQRIRSGEAVHTQLDIKDFAAAFGSPGALLLISVSAIFMLVSSGV
ncbi:MAG: CPBP family intramembrane glutamic endopeptidase [Oscillospiraceae bacterium]